MKKDKRGLEQDVLVGIIIIVISFAIIILWFTFFNHKELIDKEACRESVVIRSLPIIGEAAQYAPLRCKTNQLTIDSKKYAEDEQIKAAIANEMYDCWWMLGEGKLKPFRSIAQNFNLQKMGITDLKSACAICSTITFDKKLQEEDRVLNVLDYLETTNVPTKDFTYFKYFSEEENTNVEAEPITTANNYAIIYFDIQSVKLWEPFVKDAAIIAGGSLIVSGTPGLNKIGGKIGTAIISKVGTTGGIISLIVAAAFVGFQTVQAYRGQMFAIGKCDGKLECQQVMLVPYDAAAIGNACGELDSIP